MAIRTRLIRIGSARGLRLPEALIDQAELTDVVELRAERGRLIIDSVRSPRVGWAEAARRMHQEGHDRLPDVRSATRFDEEEWTW